jgi:hypothetical protein
MTPYSVALFLHVVGALLLMAVVTLNGLSLIRARRAVTGDQVKDAMTLAGISRIAGPISLVVLLIPGLYMTATNWGWVPWILVALAAYVAVAALGATYGIRLGMVARAAAAEGGPLTPDLSGRLRAPLLLTAWLLSVALVVGVVFLMTVKPGLPGALLAIFASVLVGMVAAIPAWRGRPAIPMLTRRSL